MSYLRPPAGLSGFVRNEQARLNQGVIGWDRLENVAVDVWSGLETGRNGLAEKTPGIAIGTANALIFVPDLAVARNL